MGMIARELELLGRTLRDDPNGRYDELYAAQQALAWALDPHAFRSPVVMLTGTQAGSTDCSGGSRRSPLPDISDPKSGAF